MFLSSVKASKVTSSGELLQLLLNLPTCCNWVFFLCWIGHLKLFLFTGTRTKRYSKCLTGVSSAQVGVGTV